MPAGRAASATARLSKKAALNDPILKRVERDYCKPAALSENRDRSRNKLFERD
jgi:hypothetical protein